MLVATVSALDGFTAFVAVLAGVAVFVTGVSSFVEHKRFSQ